MRAYRSIVVTSILGFTCLACEKCAPEQVGAGVSRLTVRNLGSIANLINEDETCGFASPDVLQSFTTQGTVGSMGSATWTVTNCELDFTERTHNSTDCIGVATTVKGRVTVSAKRTVAGTLTGNSDQPVIPMSPEAVTLEITEARMEQFLVESTSNPARLTQNGVLRAKIQPRLGASASTGVCSVPTRHALLSEIAYENALVRVEADGRDFEVDVPTSNLRAVNGTIGGESNVLDGQITVWEDLVVLPVDNDGLDPGYDPARFEESYTCTQDLKNPVSFTCGDVAPQIAQGAARLTIRSLGAIAFLVDKDTSCGFAGAAASAATRLSAAPGSIGDATTTITGCTIQLPPNTVMKTSCQGAQTIASGKITVSATRRVSGRLTGDPAQPVVPTTDTPANVEITEAIFEDFTVEENGTALTMKQGSISGKIVPRTAMDGALGACGFKTPIARFSDVVYAAGSRIALRAPQGVFETTIDGSNLTAVNGTWASDSNILRGTFSMGGENYSLPTDPADDGLDPEFNQMSFDASWMCGTVDRNAPFECNFVKPLAQGAAQLTVQTLGTLAELVEKDTSCGFSSAGVLGGVMINGTLGDPGGSAVFSISQPCEISFTTKTEAEADCNGKKTFVQGTALVRGTKTLSGYVSGDPAQPIVPTSRDPAVIDLQATLTGFKVWSEPGDNALEIVSGQLAGTLRPRTAIDGLTGACSIPTPVAAIDNIRYQDATLRVSSQGKTFDVRVGSSMLAAVNGSRDGVTNQLTGTIDVDGTSVMIPVAPGAGLVPDYSQTAFDASYACIPNLIVPAQESDCSMKKPLGEGAARLLIQALGTVTSISNTDDDCGYAANLTDPSRVVGEPGQQGSMEWEIANCELSRTGRDATRAYATDCLQRGSYFSGVATVSGMRHVDGLREEINFLFLSFDSIVPNSPESVTVNQRNIVFNEVSSYDLDQGQTVPRRKITLHSGNMVATVNPITGENEGEPGSFDIPTKVARMSNVMVTNAPITILNEGKTFNLRVDSANLSAFNGSYGRTGEKNMISGSIVVDGQTIEIPPSPLDPEFNQADFDARYVCTDNLRATVPPAP